ncbi:MAG TPA: hypothetical protein VJ696_05685 [Rhodanobacteraceae bacterium]|nr:hypothetical protein [Rhodanobacteraceae bacterium]
MKLKFVLGSAPLLATILLAATAAHADTFDVRKDAAHSLRSDVPTRGMTMAQVEQRFGAPVEKLPTAGGDAPRHPPINRWRYDGYTVYFERSRVIHSVVDAAPPSGT